MAINNIESSDLFTPLKTMFPKRILKPLPLLFMIAVITTLFLTLFIAKNRQDFTAQLATTSNIPEVLTDYLQTKYQDSPQKYHILPTLNNAGEKHFTVGCKATEQCNLKEILYFELVKNPQGIWQIKSIETLHQ